MCLHSRFPDEHAENETVDRPFGRVGLEQANWEVNAMIHMWHEGADDTGQGRRARRAARGDGVTRGVGALGEVGGRWWSQFRVCDPNLPSSAPNALPTGAIIPPPGRQLDPRLPRSWRAASSCCPPRPRGAQGEWGAWLRG